MAADLYEKLEAISYDNQIQVKPALILGKKTGPKENMRMDLQLTVKQQDQQLQEFREGLRNIACATSVAEEGLDIGKIDMVIMLDAFSNKTRITQRLGRCGRKRAGKCILLATKETLEEEIVRKHVEEHESKFSDNYTPYYYHWLRNQKVKCVEKSLNWPLFPEDRQISLERRFIDFRQDPEVDMNDLWDLEGKQKRRSIPKRPKKSITPNEIKPETDATDVIVSKLRMTHKRRCEKNENFESSKIPKRETLLQQDPPSKKTELLLKCHDIFDMYLTKASF